MWGGGKDQSQGEKQNFPFSGESLSNGQKLFACDEKGDMIGQLSMFELTFDFYSKSKQGTQEQHHQGLGSTGDRLPSSQWREGGESGDGEPGSPANGKTDQIGESSLGQNIASWTPAKG